jgi:hypothetical protein
MKLFGSLSSSSNVVQIVLLTLLSCTIFGILEMSIMWFTEHYIRPFCHQHSHHFASTFGFDIETSHINLFAGAIVASLTIFITTTIEEHLRNKYSIIHSPLFRALGVIIGSIFWFCMLNIAILVNVNNT